MSNAYVVVKGKRTHKNGEIDVSARANIATADNKFDRDGLFCAGRAANGGVLSITFYDENDAQIGIATHNGKRESAEWAYESEHNVENVQRAQAQRAGAKKKGIALKDSRDLGPDILEAVQKFARATWPEIQPAKVRSTSPTVKQLKSEKQALIDLMESQGIPAKEIQKVLDGVATVATEKSQRETRENRDKSTE